MSWIPISKAYVFISLGQETRPIGVLRKDGSVFRFGYAESWIKSDTAFSIDPINLPLRSGEFQSTRCWGCFLDAAPDNWGRKVIQATRKQLPANEVEWLIASKGNGVGSLSFNASRNHLPVTDEAPQFELVASDIIKAERLIKEGNLDEVLDLDPRILRALEYGSPIGGARPKFTVSWKGSEWICKPGRSDDLFNHPKAEYSSMKMAEACGIRIPKIDLQEVGGRDVFMIERFDRCQNFGKTHYLSAFSLIFPSRIRENDPDSPASYMRISDVIRKVSIDPDRDRKELFTRMVLNVVIGNSDDHLKNHGFLRVAGEQYTLSPAFDILPHPTQVSEMALNIGIKGRKATINNALSLYSNFGLSKNEAMSIVENVISVVSRAKGFYQDAGLDNADSRLLNSISSRKIAHYNANNPSPHSE